MKQHKILLYNFNGQELEIRLDEQKKSAYLSERHIALLFGKSRGAIYNQIKQLKLKQTDPSLCLKLKQTGVDGKLYLTNFYSLDIVSLIGQKFNSNAADILKDFINDQLNKNQVVQPDYENDIIIYNNGSISLAVKVSPEEDTVLLTQNQIAALYETTQQNISFHIKNILEEGELSTHKNYLLVQNILPEKNGIYKIKTLADNNKYYDTINGGTIIALGAIENQNTRWGGGGGPSGGPGGGEVTYGSNMSQYNLSLHSAGSHTITIGGVEYSFSNTYSYGKTTCYSDTPVTGS